MDDLTRPLTIPGVLDRAERLFPDRVAYVEGRGNGQRSITWAELAQRGRDTAAGLIAEGFQAGQRAAICAENGIDWIVAYHAIARAGGIGVLVYYDLRAGEIADQVRRPESRYLFASKSVIDKLGTLDLGVEATFEINAVSGETAVSALPFGALAARADESLRDRVRVRAPEPDDTAAIIYTSGTTGGAKGVMISHRNVVSNAMSSSGAFDFTDADSTLLVLPLHHSMPFLAAVVLVPLVGARVIIENDLKRIRDRLQEHRPTIFFGVPALFDLMYRNVMSKAETEGRLPKLQAWQARLGRVKAKTGINLAPLIFRPIHKALGGKLEFMVSGGAALNPTTQRNFLSLGLPLLQGWGMTEASPVIAVQRFSARRFKTTRYYEEHVGSVGPAIPDVEVRLIDVPEKDIRVSVSGEGEVIVRGANVFQGYWQAEEATREAKLDGWLRTGDMARLDKQGNIYLTGRSKFIIVLDSGEKVHPDELEEKLVESSLFEDIVVTGRAARGKAQVAAVVYPRLDSLRERAAAAGLTLSDATVRSLVTSDIEQLGREFAQYKRISQIELTDEPLPKTPLRKVARGRLADSYAFDFDRWLSNAEEQLAR